MVVRIGALGPGKFYGSSLPRPRFYTDVKLSDDGSRVDPPSTVLDPFLTWASDAHWSMGGLNFKRHRLQGRIEGSIKKLRAQKERSFKKKKKQGMNKIPRSTSVPPSLSPRKRALLISEDDADEGSEEGEEEVARTPIRKSSERNLGDAFDKSASARAALVSPATANKVNSKAKSKGESNDSSDSLKSNKASNLKENEIRNNEPITNSSTQISPLTRRRRILLLNDGDTEEVEDTRESSPEAPQKNRRSAANKMTNGSSPSSGGLDGVGSRTRGRKSEQHAAPIGLRKSIKRGK